MAAIPPARRRPWFDVHPTAAVMAATFGAVMGVCMADLGAAILRAALGAIVLVTVAVGMLRYLAR